MREEEQNNKPIGISQAVVSKRIMWVDICRVEAFVFVALVHCCLLFQENSLSARGGVGLFFLLAAYFSASKPTVLILKRAAIIMLVALFWRAVVSLCLGTKCKDFCDLYFLVTFDMGTLWFLRDLALCMILSVFVRKLSIVYQLALLVIMSGILGKWGSLTPPESTIFALIFYNAGIVFRLRGHNNLLDQIFPLARKVVNKKISFVLFVISLCILLCYTFKISVNQYAMLNVSIVVLLMIACAAFLEQAQSSPRFSCVISAMGRAGFFFYVTHAMALRLFVSLHLKLTGDFPNALSCFVAVCFHFALCAIIVRLLMTRNRLIDLLIFAR